MKPGTNTSRRRWFAAVALAASVLLGWLSAARAASSVSLGWDAGPNSTPAGYRLYYGTSSGSYSQTVDVGSANTATVANLVAGTTYYFAVTEYDASGVESPTSGEVSFAVAAAVPTVSLTSPGSTINGPANVTLSAAAAESGGSIAKVDFFAGSTLLGEAVNSPYTTVWNNAAPGSYSLTAVAYDSNGNTATSAAVPLTIVQFGITSFARQSSGACTFTVSGAPGSTYDVYYSGDLVTWTYLESVTNSGGTVTITDNTANGVAQRFYRLSVSAGSSVSNIKTNVRAR